MIEVLEDALIDGAPTSRDTLDQLYDVIVDSEANRTAGTRWTSIARSVTLATWRDAVHSDNCIASSRIDLISATSRPELEHA